MSAATAVPRAILALFLITVGSAGAQPALTPPSVRLLESAPFPSAMTSAPNGDAVAWVQNREGARSVWVASAPGYSARRVVDFAADDGQELSELAFSADGLTLWFTRGSAPNRAGEHPNPASHPEGAEQALWRVRLDVADARAERITSGSRATPAPVGDAVVFALRGQVMRLTTSPSGMVAAPLFRMRGSATEMRWAPGGTQLAVVSDRGTHSFIGVYDLARAALAWIDPSTDTDSSPVWSPDGTQLAFLRTPYRRTRMLFLPIPTEQAWSIRVAVVATGAAREAFRASEGSGSAFWPVQAASQLLWSRDDRIVFPWERDGFLHLYSIASRGGGWTQLDTGAHEVEYVALSHDRRHVVFNSNQGDRDRRHIWRVPAAGGRAAETVTSGEGIEWLPTPLADGAVALLRSDARVPAHAALALGPTPLRALAPQTMPADFPARQLVVPTAVTLTAEDGVQSHAQVFMPPASFTGKRPAILFLHGGSRRQMLLGWNYGSYYHHAYAMNQALALRGWVVLQLNYRSGIGYGRDFREAAGYGASGASEYRDVLAATRWLRARDDVDPARVALWGGSYGGYLTAHGLTRNPELFAAGVDIHGVHDWNVGIETFLPDYEPLDDPAAAKLAFESSPLSAVTNWRDPVLLVHGDDDRNVRFIETLTLIRQLRAQNVLVEQLVLPDEVHSFLRHASWVTAFERSLDFLERWVVKTP